MVDDNYKNRLDFTHVDEALSLARETVEELHLILELNEGLFREIRDSLVGFKIKKDSELYHTWQAVIYFTGKASEACNKSVRRLDSEEYANGRVHLIEQINEIEISIPIIEDMGGGRHTDIRDELLEGAYVKIEEIENSKFLEASQKIRDFREALGYLTTATNIGNILLYEIEKAKEQPEKKLLYIEPQVTKTYLWCALNLRQMQESGQSEKLLESLLKNYDWSSESIK